MKSNISPSPVVNFNTAGSVSYSVFVFVFDLDEVNVIAGQPQQLCSFAGLFAFIGSKNTTS